MLEQFDENTKYLNNILFSYKAIFNTSGVLNCQK
jgi:hypothetical protein